MAKHWPQHIDAVCKYSIICLSVYRSIYLSFYRSIIRAYSPDVHIVFFSTMVATMVEKVLLNKIRLNIAYEPYRTNI